MKNSSIWMAISGAAGLGFFLIANFTEVFAGSSVIAGFFQLAVNTFVFVVWGKAFLISSGFRKFVAFFGVVIPFVMAGITMVRVILPWMLEIGLIN